METGAPDTVSFKEAERAGWSEKAPVYDDFAGRITAGAVGPLLDAVGLRPGMAFLDICSGTGILAAAAAQRGAVVDAIDFAAPMVAEAAQRFPDIAFAHGDAEALGFADRSFDAAACGFGMLHLADPDQALREAHRVLRAGGRYAFTVWRGPPDHDFFRLVSEAIAAHGQSVELPPAPPMFRFADHSEARRAMEAAGFTDVAVTDLPLAWQIEGPRDVLAYVEKCTMRIAMVLDRQTAAARARIHDAILAGASAFDRGGRYEVAWPAVLISGMRP
jgi:ubiquinone/menaquinone biosynthesis C-methylase UbiE